MYLVVLGHLLNRANMQGLNRAIYSFHMPMFFMLSGVLIKKDSLNVRQYLCEKAYRLLVPGLIFIVITLPITITRITLGRADLTYIEVVKRCIYWEGSVLYNDPVWFLFCMFQVLVIQKLIHLAEMDLKWRMLIAGLAFIGGYSLQKLGIHYLGVDKCFIALGFYSSGGVYNTILMRRKCSKSVEILLAIALALTWYISGVVANSKVSMYSNVYGDYLLFLISGLSGSVVFFTIVKYLPYRAISKIYANNSVFILGTHYIAVTAYSILVKYAAISIPAINASCVITACIIMLIYIPIGEFVNKHMPILNGKRR